MLRIHPACLPLLLATLVPSARAQEASLGSEVVFRPPGMDAVQMREGVTFATAGDQALQADFYYAGSHDDRSPAAVVVFFNSGDRAGQRLKNTPQYASWGQMVASQGFVGVAYDARQGQAEQDFDALVRFMESHSGALGVDAGQVVLWSASIHVGPALDVAMGPRSYLRGIVAYYGGLNAPPFERTDLPLLLAMAGKDQPALNQRVVRLASDAILGGAPVTFLTHPAGHHGFDTLDDGPRSREILRATLAFMRSCTSRTGVRAAPPPDLARLKQEADALFAAQRFEQAVPAYEAYLAGSPQDGGALFNLGFAHSATGQIERSLECFQKTRAMGVAVPASTYNIACCYARLNRPDEAFKAVQQAFQAGFNDLDLFRTDPDLENLRSDPRYQRVLAAARKGGPAAAAEAAVSPPPPVPSAGASVQQMLSEAQQAFQRQDWRAAARGFRSALTQDPDQASAWFQLGYTSIQLQEYPAGVEAFKQALARDFQRPTTTYNLACCYALMNRKDEAFKWLDVAVQAGFDRRDLLQSDPDLDNLRRDPRFEQYLREEF